MWKQFTPDGFLQYGNFLETVTQIIPMYAIRIIGGTIYITGVFVMVYNLVKTVSQGVFQASEKAEAPARTVHVPHAGEYWHRWFERRSVLFTSLALVAVIIGGVIEILPMIWVDSNVPKIETVKPYTALEVHGRDLYIREGCVGCHSQMIRPFRSETERYGEFSKSGEFIYDRPFLWGSKRTGPDLHRVGGKYPDSWHYNHMIDPESMSPGSIMPSYSWLVTDDLDISDTPEKLGVLKTLGTPYDDSYVKNANKYLAKQASEVAANLQADGVKIPDLEKKEIVALIAYLQRLGTDIKKSGVTTK
jgi:cytochrome c oxidase cbb3-type subunit I/II